MFTGAVPEARIVLTGDGKILSEETRSLDPAHSYVRVLNLLKGTSENI